MTTITYHTRFRDGWNANPLPDSGWDVHIVWWAANQLTTEKLKITEEFCVPHRVPPMPADYDAIKKAGVPPDLDYWYWELGKNNWVAGGHEFFSTVHFFAVEDVNDVMTEKQLRTVLAGFYRRGPIIRPVHVQTHRSRVLGMPLNDFTTVLNETAPSHPIAWHIWEIEEEDDTRKEESKDGAV